MKGNAVAAKEVISAELVAVVENFQITGPDIDGLAWLVLHGKGTTGHAMFNLGSLDRIAAKVALNLEADRKSALDKWYGKTR